MFKVLIALANEEDSLKCYNMLSSDCNFEVFRANSGIDALDKYHKLNPDIFILDYDFSDINGIEILNRIELSLQEKEKVNTIQITDVSKLYKILYSPNTIEDVINIVYEFVKERKCFKLNLDDIYSYFSDFKIHLSINGCEYMKSAIEIWRVQYFIKF